MHQHLSTAPPLPGPVALPLLGVRGALLRFAHNPTRTMRHLYHTYGPLVSLARGNHRFVCAFGPAYNQQILTQLDLFHTDDLNSIPVLPQNETFRRLTAGLQLLNGAEHHEQRRLMLPAFHNNRLVSYRDDMVNLTEQRLSAWQPGQQRDLFAEMKQLSMAIGVKLLLGLDPHRAGCQLGQQIDAFMSQLFSLPALLFPVDLPGTPYRRMLRLADRLETQLAALISRRRADGTDTGDVLSMLLRVRDKAGNSLSDVSLIGQAGTILRGAYPSTALTLSWALFLLSQHPAQRASLLDELRNTLHGQAPTVSQLAQLPLLEGTIKETMRLLPPALWLARRSTAEYKLDQYTLPPGSHLLLSPFITHRLPQIYQEPDRFLVQRWLTSSPSAYEYLPFSAGPRLCLGATFAMMSMKIILAVILQRYRLDPAPGVRVDVTGIRGPEFKAGLPMTINTTNHSAPSVPVRGNIHHLVAKMGS